MEEQEKFIADGQIFNSFTDVLNYTNENHLKITKTETLSTKKGKRHIIYLDK